MRELQKMTNHVAVLSTILLVGLATTSRTFASDPEPIKSQSLRGGFGGKGSWTVTADPALYKNLPESVRAAGSLAIATSPDTPPSTFIEGGKLSGLDVDLGAAIAAKLGIKVIWSEVKFAAIVPGIQAKRYDMAISTMGDRPDRELVLDFVNYMLAGTVIVFPKGNPLNIRSPSDLCGQITSTSSGSSYVGMLKVINEDCPAGKKLTINQYPDLGSAAMAIVNGRAVATLYPDATAAYYIRFSPASFPLEEINYVDVTPTPRGIPFLKGNTALRDAVQSALTRLKSDGVYDRIFDAWAMPAGSHLTTFPINEASKYYNPDSSNKSLVRPNRK